MRKPICVLAAAALLAGTIGPPLAAAHASPAKIHEVHGCKKVVVQFHPEGSGGAIKIRSNIGCTRTRRLVRKCIKNELPSRWTSRYNTARTRIVLVAGERRIGYLPVGGGGCVSA